MAGGEIMKLPEGCISHIISLTSPLDSCRSAMVSTTFRSAAESDTVWERFLPPDYKEILSRAVDPVDFSSKRDLYFRLCNPILIDAGKMSFALERSSGRKCYTLSARELWITWGSTPHYWTWDRLDDSRFAEVAELLNVCWLEIRGKIRCKLLSSKTLYTAYLIFRLAQGSHGFRSPNQEASVRVGSQISQHTVYLHLDPGMPQGRQTRSYQFRNRHRLGVVQLPPEGEKTSRAERNPHMRGDGWMEVELGEFFNDDGDEGDVDIIFSEIKGGHWKCGLIVEGIEVRPKK